MTIYCMQKSTFAMFIKQTVVLETESDFFGSPLIFQCQFHNAMTFHSSLSEEVLL